MCKKIHLGDSGCPGSYPLFTECFKVKMLLQTSMSFEGFVCLFVFLFFGSGGIRSIDHIKGSSNNFLKLFLIM